MVTGLLSGASWDCGQRVSGPGKRNDAEYYYKDHAKNSDGSWYGGVPLWSLAEQQGMRSASMYWVGSEAEICGEAAELLGSTF